MVQSVDGLIELMGATSWPARLMDRRPLNKENKIQRFSFSMKNIIPVSVLRIHLILMRIRIQILDPHWKKMDPDPGHFFKIY